MLHSTPKTKTQIWRIDALQPGKEAVADAASLICEGGVVIFPTETFYGLGGLPLRVSAIERIYQIKGRDFQKPLPLIAASPHDVKRAVAKWPDAAQRLAEVFWPGPLTLVLSAAAGLPSLLHGGTSKVAIRVSSHPVALALASAVGGLLISTSANRTGQPPQVDPERMPLSFLEQVDGMLDAGKVPGHLPSTIVDVSTSTPHLIRSGCLPWEQIEEVLTASPHRSFHQLTFSSEREWPPH